MLNFAQIDQAMLSEHQMYIISTPVTLYLWLGKELEQQKVLGSLRILNAFTLGILGEKLEYKPGYKLSSGQNIMCLRLRIETQGYESVRFRSFFGKKKITPGSEDRNNYLMLGRPKMAYYIEEQDQ